MVGREEGGTYVSVLFCFFSCVHSGKERKSLLAVKLHQHLGIGAIHLMRIRDLDVGKNVVRLIT